MAYKKIGVRERFLERTTGPHTRSRPKPVQEVKYVYGEKSSQAIRGAEPPDVAALHDHFYRKRFDLVKEKVSSLLAKKKLKQDQLRRLQMITDTGQFKSNLQMELDHSDFFRQLREDEKRELAEKKIIESKKQKLFGSAMRDDLADHIGSNEEYQVNTASGSYRQSPMQDEMARLEKENKALKEKLESLRSPITGVIDAITSLENKVKEEKEVHKIITYGVSTALGGFFVIAGLLEWIFG
ncbi:MAG: hypothetical protein WC761_02070 [Candidatus Paceibacterota bacterium]|jgi:hypothetical protein